MDRFMTDSAARAHSFRESSVLLSGSSHVGTDELSDARTNGESGDQR